MARSKKQTAPTTEQSPAPRYTDAELAPFVSPFIVAGGDGHGKFDLKHASDDTRAPFVTLTFRTQADADRYVRLFMRAPDLFQHAVDTHHRHDHERDGMGGAALSALLEIEETIAGVLGRADDQGDLFAPPRSPDEILELIGSDRMSQITDDELGEAHRQIEQSLERADIADAEEMRETIDRIVAERERRQAEAAA